MSTITRTRRLLASLGAVAAVAGAVVAGAPAAQAATRADACDQAPAPALTTRWDVHNGSGGGALDLLNGNEVNGQPIGLWTANQSPAQTWSFWGYCDGTTAISHGLSKVAGLDTGSGSVRLQDTPGGLDGLNRPRGDWMPANQKWRLTDEDRGWYLIRNVATGQCLKAPGTYQAVSMASCDTADPNQRWLLG
ncbi:RICIN domain-containing protein [Kitasatospora sp. NPDC048286]|uniref:RICIN domain-containing protein n=1 Tax=unclassified Kitasatospora TaxID=2633591 RepID=UPI00371112AD